MREPLRGARGRALTSIDIAVIAPTAVYVSQLSSRPSSRVSQHDRPAHPSYLFTVLVDRRGGALLGETARRRFIGGSFVLIPSVLRSLDLAGPFCSRDAALQNQIIQAASRRKLLFATIDSFVHVAQLG